MDGRIIASAWTARRGRRPQHVRTLLAGEPGDLASGPNGGGLGRFWEVSGRIIGSAWTARRGRRPQHVRTLLAREPGDLASGQSGGALVRIGKVMSRSRCGRPE